MGRLQKKKNKHKTKQQQQKPLSTTEIISKAELSSDNIIRLKLTTRKGTRIESVPANKLQRLAKNQKLYWTLEDNWILLIGCS